jgi:peptidoglycan/LPS O-acetylase OafA/YrhL
LWLRRDGGQRFIGRLADLAERRGGLFLFIVPLVLVQFAVRPFFPAEHDWTDFIFTLVFFVYGYILYADERFARAIRRDWLPMLIGATLSTLFFFAAGAADLALEWMETPGTPGFYLLWSAWSVNGWCWTLFMLYVGMRFLEFRNRWLEYGGQAIMPFYLFHQPVIIVIAYFVVGWEAPILAKLLVVVTGSFIVSLSTYELLVRHINPVRVLLGMKPREGRADAPLQARR